MSQRHIIWRHAQGPVSGVIHIVSCDAGGCVPACLRTLRHATVSHYDILCPSPGGSLCWWTMQRAGQERIDMSRIDGEELTEEELQQVGHKPGPRSIR